MQITGFVKGWSDEATKRRRVEDKTFAFSVPPSLRRFVASSLLLIGLATLLASCAKVSLPTLGGAKSIKPTITGATVQGLNLNNPLTPTPSDLPITLSAAKNEWASFSVEVAGLPADFAKKHVSLRIRQPNSGAGAIDGQNFSAYQILSMPIDVNRAGFVRHTGLSVTHVSSLPRALLPMPMNNGSLDLSKARDPNEPQLFWIDLHIPPETPAGDYVASCDLVEGNIETPIATVPVKLKVYDFVLPDERHLSMVSRIDWDALQPPLSAFRIGRRPIRHAARQAISTRDQHARSAGQTRRAESHGSDRAETSADREMAGRSTAGGLVG